ncbi:MAG: hypothetical protein EA405_10920 [Rhodospirillales bacterium]|nr:MAG: hypothetical protein EA405_10920 [Rhodospirillales bacterium]
MRPLRSSLLFLVLAFGASGHAAADEPYRLGVALGLTGPGAPYSRQALDAIELAVDEINEAGGMLGRHRIEIHLANTRTRPDVAEVVARELIERDGVRAIIGTYSSDTALAIKPICRDARVLHIATISNSEDLTRLDPSPYTFSVVPNTYMMAKAVALAVADLAQEYEWRRYATIASDYSWGRSSQQVLVEQLARLVPHVELIEELWPPLGYVGFNALVVAVANLQPDFVLESLAGVDNALWHRAVWDYRLADQVAVPGGLVSVSELMFEGRWIRRGTWARTRAPFFAHSDEAMMQAFIDRHLERYGRYPSDWAVMAYDGVHALRQGIEAVDRLDSDRVKDGLTGATVDTTRGRLTFRDIDNQLGVPAYFGRVADDPDYAFPIFHDLKVFPAETVWRPEAEIAAAREGRP